MVNHFPSGSNKGQGIHQGYTQSINLATPLVNYFDDKDDPFLAFVALALDSLAAVFCTFCLSQSLCFLNWDLPPFLALAFASAGSSSSSASSSIGTTLAASTFHPMIFVILTSADNKLTRTWQSSLRCVFREQNEHSRTLWTLTVGPSLPTLP